MTLCIFNNDWTELEEITIPIQSEAVQYGVGLFETLRTYQDKSLPFLQAHIHRLFYSLADLQLTCDFSPRQVEDMILRLVEKSDSEFQRLKVLVIPDGILVTSSALLLEATDGYRLTIWQGHRGMAQHKSTSYIDCHLAWQTAQSNGFDDSILMDDHGQVYETGRANLFWVKDGKVFTREHHVLPGVMRDFVLANDDIETSFDNISLQELLSADEVFVTNSIRGIVPVSAINDAIFQNHEVTQTIHKQLLEFVRH